MTNKLVHVNSYVKDDGTKVKEHYRGGGSTTPESFDNTDDFGQNEYNYKNPFETGISMNVDGTVSEETSPEVSEDAEKLQKQPKAHPIIDKAKECINTILQKMRLKKVKAEEVSETLKRIQAGQQESIIREQLTLDYLTKIKNQTEYQKVYKQYLALRRLNREMNESMARLKYLNNQNNIEGVVNELENMNTNFDEVKQQIKDMNPLPKHNQTLPARNEGPKQTIDILMSGFNLACNTPDAAALWDVASEDFDLSKDYITQNGALIYNLYNLPSKELQDIVQKKVQGQLGVQNLPGIILKSDKRLSQEIAISPELKHYYLKNKDNLQRGEVIKGGSTKFDSSENLAKAIGHSDILYSYIDKQGDLTSVILDTYDFNKDDPRWSVQEARKAQDQGTIRNYYEIIITKTPKSVLEQW